MLVIKQRVHLLKQVLVFGEVLILLTRLVSQVTFSLSSCAQIAQLLIAAILYCREYCSEQAQVYILLNIFILYLLLYNQTYHLFVQVKNDDEPFVQNFNNNYIIWGYAIEAIFRMVGLIIAWRVYQFSQLLQAHRQLDFQQNDVPVI